MNFRRALFPVYFCFFFPARLNIQVNSLFDYASFVGTVAHFVFMYHDIDIDIDIILTCIFVENHIGIFDFSRSSFYDYFVQQILSIDWERLKHNLNFNRP